MGELYANKGKYGLIFRTNYMRVEDENSRHGLADTRIKTKMVMIYSFPTGEPQKITLQELN